jgi:hypothetical protein
MRGAVALPYITASRTAMLRAGSSDTNSCPATDPFRTAGELKPLQRPASALRCRELKVL